MRYESYPTAIPDGTIKLTVDLVTSIDYLLTNYSDSWNCLTLTRHMLMFHEWLPYPCGNYGKGQVYNWLCEHKFTTPKTFYNNTMMRSLSPEGTYCDGNWAYYESACIRLKQHLSDQVQFISSSNCEYRRFCVYIITDI